MTAHHYTREEYDAIVRLIAAAPDMLAALLLAKEDLAHFGLRTLAADVVNDAIAKATGEQQ